MKPSLTLVAVLALAVLPALSGHATCGGGGGGGGGGAASNAYRAQWTPWQAALNRSVPVLLYLQGKPSEHPVLCCTKAAQELSQKYPFVKIPYAKAAKDRTPPDRELVDAYGLDKRPAILVMTDAYGNELSRLSSGLAEQKLAGLFDEARKASAKLEEKLKKALEKAQASEEKGEIAKAVDGYQEILKTKGAYPPAQEAKKRFEALLAKAKKDLEALLKPEADPAAGLKTLKEWQKAYKGTDLEKAILDAIKTLTQRAQKP